MPSPVTAARGLRLRAAFAFAAAMLFAVACGARGEEARRADAARLMNELMSGTAPVGGPFTLPDSGGRSRSLGEFRGKVVLLYFGYTSCPDVCPTDLQVIARAIELLGTDGDGVQPIFVTLDPERDTPEVMGAYASAFHPRFVALRGTEDQVRGVATAYKTFFEKVTPPGSGTYFIDHTAFTYLLDRTGAYVAFIPPGTNAERMAAMVRDMVLSR